jgi:hypothetical protein
VPEGDVLLHRDLGGHPVVGAAVEVVLPGPLVLERPELVDVHGPAVEEPLVLDVYALTEVVGLLATVSTALEHRGSFLLTGFALGVVRGAGLAPDGFLDHHGHRWLPARGILPASKATTRPSRFLTSVSCVIIAAPLSNRSLPTGGPGLQRKVGRQDKGKSRSERRAGAATG